MKRILITGKDSYIGTSFEHWISQPQFNGLYEVYCIDMRENTWKSTDFTQYDVVFHVAGIAHTDISKISERQKKLYYHVNCDLAVETAEKAKKSGIKQFIYMSSIIVYGEGSSIDEKRIINSKTPPQPSNFYGDSKWRAEQKLVALNTTTFKVAILRPPMIYGKESKGNYQVLSKMARKLPLFPAIKNERSVLYVGNLCEYIRLLIDYELGGVHFPQNAASVSTTEIVQYIAKLYNKKIWITPLFNWSVYLLARYPGKIGKIINKAFGTLAYEQDTGICFSGAQYQLFNLSQSLKLTELGEDIQ